MAIDSHGHEHEYEPQHGLPERLPPDERILWQGSPHVATLAIEAFHMRAVAFYFAALMAWRAATAWAEGGAAAALPSLILPMLLSVTALGLLGTLAWLTARTAVYTITDKRVVMRIGVVLTLTFNLPLRVIESAGVRRRRSGHGDLVLALSGPDHIPYLHLWPHARPWRLSRTEPMLRALPQVQTVAEVLAQALAACHGVPAQTATNARPASTTPSASNTSGRHAGGGRAAPAAMDGGLGHRPLVIGSLEAQR
jgi:hypothetical protein